MVSGSALAADMPVKAVKAPPPAAFDPWDIAFGSAIMNDYIFRGITQSNHKPSVAAYFEPRYNVNKDLQLYIGTSAESISFANRAAAEVDIYGGIRPTFGAFAFDFGVWGYLYPGGNCCRQRAAPAAARRQAACAVSATTIFLANGNVMKKDVSFFEVYGKVNYTINDNWQVGVNEYYSPNFLNLGAWGNYASITGKYTAPSTMFGTSGVGMYVSGEFGRQWLGTSDAFYGTGAPASRPFPNGIHYAELQHLEYRHRLHLQGVHARSALLRHRPVEGQLQRLHQRLQRLPAPTNVTADQSERRRLQLVRRGRHRQALGRPDGDDQPEVRSSYRRQGAAERSAAPFFCGATE